MTCTERPIAVDLFCGAGGMSLGFEQAGFNVVAAVDNDPIHIEVYRSNFPHANALIADLSAIPGAEIRNGTSLGDAHIDVLFGGPPCQGFSIVGRKRRDDPRNELLTHFGRLILELAPSYFVVENVEGLTYNGFSSFLDEFVALVGRKYFVVHPIQSLNAIEFGVPQARRRVFILGYLPDLPAPKYPTGNLAKSPTVWEAIGDLPLVSECPYLQDSDTFVGNLKPALSDYARILRGEKHDEEDKSVSQAARTNELTGCQMTKHTTATIERFQNTRPGSREPISRFHRLAKNGYSYTLRAGSGSSHGSYTAPRPIHPVEHRVITVREAARLQSFPDLFQFHKTKWHGFRQIGNSVPPLLARAVARSVLAAMKSR